MKKIDYFQIVKEALKITKENKFLWWFGLLVTFGGGGMSFNYNFSGGGSEDKIDEMVYMNMVRRVTFYWEMYKEWIILGIVLVVLIGIFLYVLGLIGRGALIDSVFKILKKEEANFKKGFKNGLKHFEGMFIINISVFLSILGLLVILFFPVARLFILKSFIAGVLIGIMAFLIFISFTVFILFLKRFAEIYLVSSGVGSVESFKLSYKLIEKNILSIFLMWLVCVGISFALGIGMVIIIVTMGLPAIFLGVIIYGLVGNLGVIVLSVLAIALVMILIIFINTIFNVFFQTIWILFFKEIANPDNDSEEILAVPQKNNEEILANNVVEPGGVYNAKE